MLALVVETTMRAATSRPAAYALTLAALVGSLAALTPGSAHATGSNDICFAGRWTERASYGRQDFRFRLRLRVVGVSGSYNMLRGAFTWRQVHVTGSERNNGRVLGRELVEGTLYANHLFQVHGVRVTSANLARDRYRFDLRGDRITGQSASLENDWTARITGRRVTCPAASTR